MLPPSRSRVVPGRHDRLRETEPGSLAKASFEALDGSQRRPAATPRRRPPCPAPAPRSRAVEARARATARSSAGSLDGGAPDEADVEVLARDTSRPHRRARTATSNARRSDGTPTRARRGHADAGRCHQCLDLDQDRPGTLHDGRDRDTGRLGAAGAQERAGRIGHIPKPFAGHLQDAGLLGRAEAVLGTPEQSQRAVSVALQHQHHIDQVLERPWPGKAAVLGHMAHEDHRRAVLVGPGRQPGGRLPHLARRTRRDPRARPRSASGRSRPPAAPGHPLGRREHRRRAPSPRAPGCGTREPIGEAQPVGAQMQLVRRLLARCVQDVGAAIGAGPRRRAPRSERPRPRSPARASTCRCPARRRAAPGRRARARRPGRDRPRRCRRSAAALDGSPPHAAGGGAWPPAA